MKNINWTFIRPILVLIAIFFLNNIDMFAGGPPGPPGPPGGGGSPGGCWPPSACIPIDGGISFLLVAGTVYGAKVIKDISKKKAE